MRWTDSSYVTECHIEMRHSARAIVLCCDAARNRARWSQAKLDRVKWFLLFTEAETFADPQIHGFEWKVEETMSIGRASEERPACLAGYLHGKAELMG